jgi:hypothetical protein
MTGLLQSMFRFSFIDENGAGMLPSIPEKG